MTLFLSAGVGTHEETAREAKLSRAALAGCVAATFV
jgi:hypothetical protein